jgi:alpha-beta hydrolase superfamily lysophospholipase
MGGTIALQLLRRKEWKQAVRSLILLAPVVRVAKEVLAQ